MRFRLRSFRVRIALLSTLLSAAVLAAFAFWTWAAVQRMILWRVDETIREMSDRYLGMRQGPRHWQNVGESLEFVLGDPSTEPFILLVRGRDGAVLQASKNWPYARIPAESVPTPVEAGFPEPPPDPRPRGMGFRGGMQPPPPSDAPPGAEFQGGPPPPPPPPRLPVRTLSFFTRQADGHEWRVGIVSNPEVTLALGLNLSRYYAEMARLRAALALALPAALVLIAGGGWWLAERALRPVRALTRTAEGITAQGLDRRISEYGEDAEFARLIRVFNGMLNRLEKSFGQAVRFSADAAHELKTPLTVLQGELEQAVQEAPAGSAAQQTLVRLLEEVQRLKAITRKLLLLSQADAGRLTPHLEPVDLSDMVAAIADDLEILAPDRRVEKRLESGLQVQADPDLLRQVVQNIAGNAIKYNVPGGTVRLELRKAGPGVRLTVGNSGPGIPPEDRDRVFERFYRADKARNRRVDGVGLGLSLSREIARAHGGDLVLEESREGWTSFTLTLPAARAMAAGNV